MSSTSDTLDGGVVPDTSGNTGETNCDNDDMKVSAINTSIMNHNKIFSSLPSSLVQIENISLTPDQQTMYNSAYSALNEELIDFLPAPIPKIVSVDRIQQPRQQQQHSSTTMPSVAASNSNGNAVTALSNASPQPSTPTTTGDNHHHHHPHEIMNLDATLAALITSTSNRNGQQNEMLRALDELETLEKEEQNLAYKTNLSQYLTELLTGQSYESSTAAIRSLDALEEAVPRRVCQHPFRKNDIVWVCRTCQADETCVLCHACFSQSNHEGHDVAFYHAQAGGCCDCGDPDAWNPDGFCPRHGPNASASSSSTLPESLTHRVRGVVPACIDWMVHTIATNAETAYGRANPIFVIEQPPTTTATRTPSKNDDTDQRLRQQELSTRTNFSEYDERASPSSPRTEHMESNDVASPVALRAPESSTIMNEIYVDEYDFILEEHFPRNPSMMNRSHVFSPLLAAATSNDAHARATRQEQEVATAAAITLGNTGRLGHGLYLVLHADDIHSTSQFLDALKEFYGTTIYHLDTLLTKIVRALRMFGQLVIWGTMELVQDCGITQVHLWMDGDKVAAGKIGSIVLERAERLRKHGIICSILTRDELILEQRAVAVLQWLSYVARSCDPLCQTVAECILPNRHLVPLLIADFKMSARVTKAWYSLLLTLLAVPTFKSHLAAAYCDTYRDVTAKYARGMGVLERSGYTLSVQFLNRVTYVLDLVQGRDLLGKLGKSLYETLSVAARSHSINVRLNPNHFIRRLDPNHFILTHRRYSPCISDFKCVLNVDGMSRVIAARGGTFLKDWIATLSLAQFMDAHKWRDWSQGHVEDESRGWVGAFNLSISLGGLFERILCWADDTTSPIKEGPLAGDLMSCMELTLHLLTNGIDSWQQREEHMYSLIQRSSVYEPYGKAPEMLPLSTIANQFGSATQMSQIPIFQGTSFSFHLPLHRFLVSCLRELCLRQSNASGDISDLFHSFKATLSEEKQEAILQGLMEFPVLVLSRAAQIRAGMWRRNGTGLNDQVLNYAEPPFCRHMRDADLLLTQFASICRTNSRSQDTRPSTDIGLSFLANLLLFRFELFDFLGFAQAQSISRPSDDSNTKDVVHEPVTGLQLNAFPQGKDAGVMMLLLEDFLYFIVTFVTELPPVVPRDKEDQTNQAKLRLLREVVHRLASGPKTHSELSEVHHVLSHWDNFLLSEEGKLVNPDDATGAALATALDEVAERKTSRGKMEPDKWELKQAAWEYYDPAFFHISLRSHQIAATSEGRPKPSEDSNAPFGWKSKPYAPVPIDAHPFFERLRRDATADSTLLAVAYKAIHLHCRKNVNKSTVNLRGNLFYLSGEKSETSLARAIHFLTLGAYAWNRQIDSGTNWRDKGGGSVGSVFFQASDEFSPNASSWVKACLLFEPSKLLDCEWYVGEESALLLLEGLAKGNGSGGGFVAQDSAVRAGAAWLCEFALSCCPEAKAVLNPNKTLCDSATLATTTKDVDIEMRKQAAKEKALAKMKAQAAKFSALLEVDDGSEGDSDRNDPQDMSVSAPSTPGTPNRAIRLPSFGSTFSSASSFDMRDVSVGSIPQSIDIKETNEEDTHVPPRLLQNRPRCIICNDEDGAEGRFASKTVNDDGEGQRKKSRRRTENALGFVGYAQASVVLKGGGGPPPELTSQFSSVFEFVGTHVALCGHAVHSECCESYLATVSHREDRQIGKRDEFRCPLCQRLSNCLIPFIDVGMDWIESPSLGSKEADAAATNEYFDKKSNLSSNSEKRWTLLHDFLRTTPWWVSFRGKNVRWDGHSAFVDFVPPNAEDDEVAIRKPSRIRSLRKKDLYQAWNSMMHTPRFVRRKLRRSSSSLRSAVAENEHRPIPLPSGEDSTGETVVWRRFMDQISDISYRADTKRLGDDHLHNLFGEFRHYIVEKYAYSTCKAVDLGDSTDWPSCLFKESLTDNRRQEMSREKLMSKLLLSIQSFTYSCSSETFEAKRSYRKSLAVQSEVAKKSIESSSDSVRSRFGIRGLCCKGKLVLMPAPSADEDGDSWPFDGRVGKLRYFGLTVMAASGAVAADLVQLVLPFPFVEKNDSDFVGDSEETPTRAPIAYPLLFGHVLTHVVAAMCATCGRARARSDLLDVVWPIPFSIRGSFAFLDLDRTSKNVDSVVEDCEGFMKLGLIARILQVLLGKLLPETSLLHIPSSWIDDLNTFIMSASTTSSSVADMEWTRTCGKLVIMSVSAKKVDNIVPASFNVNEFQEACSLAALQASSYLIEAGTIFQILVPGAVSKYDTDELDDIECSQSSAVATLQEILSFLTFESVDQMIDSDLVQKIVSFWFDMVYENTRLSVGLVGNDSELQSRLFRTQGFRVYDWPSTCSTDNNLSSMMRLSSDKDTNKVPTRLESLEQPQDDTVTMAPTAQQIVESFESTNTNSTIADILRSTVSPSLLTFQSKKSVSLLGGFSPDLLYSSKWNQSPRVSVIPTSYTDLYAELASLMPDCEQTAVCLVCGEVLNAGGRGECTKHSYKCGAGAGIFFLLQECSGLLIHKARAAYIHSPYVDSHGETPQYRGRPLNLDVNRYEHLREVWYSHGVRQKVLTERGMARQVILPDYY